MSCGIYKITNNITGNIYIGQSIRIEERWRDHKSAKDNCPIHKSIRKHGIDNFTFEIIEECDESLLNEKEQYWIQYYDSYIHGYNATMGGEGGSKHSHRKIKELWASGLGTIEISEITGASLKTIQRSLKEEEFFNVGECQSRNKCRLFSQYTPEGKWVATYHSFKELKRAININIELVKRCLYDSEKEEKTNISAGGFQWRYGDNKDDIPEIKIQRIGYKKAVAQYDKNNNLIKVYPSIAEAKRQTNIDHISHCCLGQLKTAGGYIWKYVDINGGISNESSGLLAL